MDDIKVKEYLKVLACPKCKGDLIYFEKDKEGFFCKKCKLLYPILEDIPIMFIDSAIKLEEIET